MRIVKIFFIALLFHSVSSKGQNIVKGSEGIIQSPDKKLTVRFYQKASPTGQKTLFYKVDFDQKNVINESELDLQLNNRLSEQAMALPVDKHTKWFENLTVQKLTTLNKDTSWTPLYGERSVIRDHFNALRVELQKDDNTIYNINVEIRAYNEGVAIRYDFPVNPKGSYYSITSENTEFSLPAGTLGWHAAWAQAPYHLVPLKNWKEESERPLTLKLPNGLYVALAEAQMVDFARGKFKLSPSKENTIVTSMDSKADLISPCKTPWRVIMIAEKPGILIENSHLMLNLNTPNQIKAPDWIKPGKIMRVAALTSADAYANIDFAVQHHLQYILFDCCWYGDPLSFSSDATKVGIPNFDLQSIIKYAKQKGVGIWLYVNQQALVAQSDSLFSVYHKWGIKGVKFGFVQVGSHRWTTWLEKAIQQAAANEIMVNIHDDWRPTGEQRTWPNLMTAEGIRGNEEMPDATHNTILPFTRYLAGAADYTICYYNKRIQTTHAHQLAMAAVYYSPIQTMFWYDKPSQYQGEPELEFWEKIPTSWDETRVLHGEPGEYISTARRRGDEWFVGTMTNNNARTLPLSLNFLPKGKTYLATIYSDDVTVKTNTHVSVKKMKVTSATVMNIKLLASGGEAMYLTPVK
ncbi:glycoside hydrolase family 97 protein [Mucilaginibacter terrae]|uniref:Alpha-glucosidase n=1 Tax=Mucilaginibacter terrae TaxID=1955052 RepID=A0ABU3GNU0_9SPHI|nr:glycoside hydrolase family 97 catalytic domain-containing protein [Mucilaginibacter terrae]MDT3401186.1 hypothetical protein [Mucilaginibacter terrae]